MQTTALNTWHTINETKHKILLRFLKTIQIVSQHRQQVNHVEQGCRACELDNIYDELVDNLAHFNSIDSFTLEDLEAYDDYFKDRLTDLGFKIS
jgi:hypothetical protein